VYIPRTYQPIIFTQTIKQAAKVILPLNKK